MKATRINTLVIRLGGILILGLLMPSGLGLLLDIRFDKLPLFALIGALIGIGASTVLIVRLTIRAMESVSPITDTVAGPDERRDGKEDKV